MKIPVLLSAAACGLLLLVSCKDKDGTRVPPREPSRDGTNTSSSGVHSDKPETPPSTRSGYKGTGAGTDAADNPQQAQPPAVNQPATEQKAPPNPEPAR